MAGRLDEEHDRAKGREQHQWCSLRGWVITDWAVHALILLSAVFAALTNSGLWEGVPGKVVALIAIIAALLTAVNKFLHSEKNANIARTKRAGYGKVKEDIQNLRTVGVKAAGMTDDKVYSALEEFNKQIAAIDGIADG